jgi:hypothetical protein
VPEFGTNFVLFFLIEWTHPNVSALPGDHKTRSESIMKTRKLGNSDLQITPVGYGAWALGGTGWEYSWGPQDDNDSYQIHWPPADNGPGLEEASPPPESGIQ